MNKLFTISALTLASFALYAFSTDKKGYEPESIAIDFKLKNIDSKMVSLKDFKKAEGFIVIFTCNHCPFAKAYEDRIIALDKKYNDLGYPVIAINSNDSISYPDDSWSQMIIRAKEKGFTFPYLYDESQEIAKTYGALKTPHVYLLQKVKKTLIVKYIGAIDNHSEDASKVTVKYLENAIDELRAGKEITVKTTKAIGCGIKWRK